jgi:DNA-binding XRE family transcriptional regulator
VEHREAELREVAPYAAPGDNPARFLRELRQLRDAAGLGQTDLAVRAHYPRDAIRAAEAGPALPDLPVLSAYVRGCGGAVTEWEERWRALTSSPALPLLPTRTAGGSDAASAGARVGSVSLAADAHDPSLVMAALSRVAHGIAAEPQPAPFAAAPSPSPASAVPVHSTGSDGVAAEPASLFGAPGRAAAPDAGWGSGASDADRATAPSEADRGTAGPRATAPSVPAPVSALGRPASVGTLPSKSAIVAVAVLVCLVVVILALVVLAFFHGLRTRARGPSRMALSSVLIT